MEGRYTNILNLEHKGQSSANDLNAKFAIESTLSK